MVLGKKGELINFKSKGTWSDSLGNYGRGRCQGSGLLENKNIFAIDLLEMEPADNVSFFKADIENIDQIKAVNDKKGTFDLVISDLAPNITRIGAIDNESILELNMLTLQIAVNLSKTQSKFLVKTFQNNNFKYFRSFMEKKFSLVQNFKPLASKNRSSEIYLYGEN